MRAAARPHLASQLHDLRGHRWPPGRLVPHRRRRSEGDAPGLIGTQRRHAAQRKAKEPQDQPPFLL